MHTRIISVPATPNTTWSTSTFPLGVARVPFGGAFT